MLDLVKAIIAICTKLRILALNGLVDLVMAYLMELGLAVATALG
jgi:hypothetical protein